MNRFDQFQKQYDEATSFIKSQMDDPLYGKLVTWMLETDANNYAYLADGYGHMVGSAESFASLVKMISHAVYDDGEIAFFSVDGQPRIIFSYGGPNLETYVLTSAEKSALKLRSSFNINRPYKIAQLNISPNDFPVVYDEWYKNDIRRCFEFDAMRNIESAKAHYSKYQLWDENWYIELKDKQ